MNFLFGIFFKVGIKIGEADAEGKVASRILIKQGVIEKETSIIDGRIIGNERALAKAAKRRGSWEEKKGYSGDTKPEDPDEVPAEMTDDELDDVVENETQGHEGASIDTSAKPAGNAAGPDEESYLSRTAAERALGELKDLKNLGILTEEEYGKKKSEIYSRLG